MKHDAWTERKEVKKMMRPEDRAAWFTQQKIERYEWAKQVDPAAVAAFEVKAAAERKQ